MRCHSISFSGHAVRRMFERGVSQQEVLQVIEAGESVAGYPDDQPYPSELLLGFSGDKPIHVVIAYNEANCIVITAYIPDSNLWNDDFRTRKN